MSSLQVQLPDEVVAPLTVPMAHDILSLADDWRLTEADAVALYAAARQTAAADVRAVARQLYLDNRSGLLHSARSLLQARATGNDAVLVATDQLIAAGWIANFATFIRESSQRCDELRAAAPRSNAAEDDLWQVHWERTVANRQVAAECLFFICYQTQLTAGEVACVVDLIRDLTNAGLGPLDPTVDIPNAFEAPQQDSWIMSSTSSVGRPKDFAAWERELVECCSRSGQLELLRCCSVLVAAVLAALDTKTIMIDRTTHEPNVFGMVRVCAFLCRCYFLFAQRPILSNSWCLFVSKKGNAILPPGSSSTQTLTPLHSCLSKGAASDWKRTDILGLLMASYAMLLRSSPSALSSPRGGGPVPTGTIDVRKSWMACIEAPAELKSFSFATHSLLPALKIPATPESTCDVSEFLLSVVAEFASNYLDVLSTSGDRPISRFKWEQDANEDLNLRRSAQDRDRAFQASFGTNQKEQAVLPAVVNLLQRPDCMDDVFAFATAACSLGPEYSLLFWSKDKLDGAGLKLASSRALSVLREELSTDETLRPVYLSFLAALALAKNGDGSLDGTKAIHEIISENQVDDASWSDLFEVLRWYARELSPQNGSSVASASTVGGSSNSSTAYYYFADDSSTSAGQLSSSSEAVSRPKSRELGEANTYLLLSHLTLILNAASGSSAARTAMLGVDLPVKSSVSREVVGKDSSLMILFSLAVAPLAPDVRGKVFSTIAALLCLDGAEKEECDQIRKATAKSWELLEAYHVLPIHLLEQFSSVSPTELQNVSGLAFPPSSTALVSECIYLCLRCIVHMCF
jgi:hypothetical protein